MVKGASAQEHIPAALAETIMEDATKEGCTTAGPPTATEDPDAIGRVKAPPVCVDSTLKKEAMSTEVLQQWVIPVGAILPVVCPTTTTTTATSMLGGSNWSRSSTGSTATVTHNTTAAAAASPLPKTVTTTTTHDPQIPNRVPVSVVSVSSNNSWAGDSHAALSSDEMTEVKTTADTTTTAAAAAAESHSSVSIMQPPTHDLDASEQLNAKVALRKTSRQGRSSQRWTGAAASLTGNYGSASTTLAKTVSSSTAATAQDVHSPSAACCGETSSVASAYNNNNYPHASSSQSHEPIMRLVTGCVPILRSGKILFVSASRKSAWILPKGGWEQDESMEEAAIRECFEEAGCLGTLGPALSPIQHETRKAKKRRLDHEQFLEQQKKSKTTESRIPNAVVATSKENPKPSTATIASTHSTTEATGATPKEADSLTNETPGNEDCTAEVVAVDGNINHADATPPSLPPPAPLVLSAEAMSRIRQFSQSSRGGHHTDNETMSVGSTLSTTYSHVQMTLFPLYVRKIEGDWPEKGRFRKAVEIDEAIEMLVNRPELQAALQEVKERGLHLVLDRIDTVTTAEPDTAR